MRSVKREPYLSDLSDEQWALIEPMITAWKQGRVARSATGDPGSCDLREVVNAIFYQNRTGCQWRFLPHDFPAWSAVFYYFGLWREDGLDQRIQELLRCQVREKARRLEDPSLVIIDTQSVRAAAGVPKTTTGLDANKKVSGRKRGLAVDVLGLIIGVVESLSAYLVGPVYKDVIVYVLFVLVLWFRPQGLMGKA